MQRLPYRRTIVTPPVNRIIQSDRVSARRDAAFIADRKKAKKSPSDAERLFRFAEYSYNAMAVRRNLVPLLALLFALATSSMSAGVKNNDCLDCHSDNTLFRTNSAGKAISLFVDKAKLAASAHGTNSCISCHADATVKHPDDNKIFAPVKCATCHQRQTDSYGTSVHGLASKSGQIDATTCQDCHDSHEVLPASSPASPLYFTRQAETCGKCHPKEARDFQASVHGKAIAAGKRDAP